MGRFEQTFIMGHGILGRMEGQDCFHLGLDRGRTEFAWGHLSYLANEIILWAGLSSQAARSSLILTGWYNLIISFFYRHCTPLSVGTSCPNYLVKKTLFIFAVSLLTPSPRLADFSLLISSLYKPRWAFSNCHLPGLLWLLPVGLTALSLEL